METADIRLELVNIVVGIVCEELYNFQQKTVIFSLWKLNLEFKDI